MAMPLLLRYPRPTVPSDLVLTGRRRELGADDIEAPLPREDVIPFVLVREEVALLGADIGTPVRAQTVPRDASTLMRATVLLEVPLASGPCGLTTLVPTLSLTPIGAPRREPLQ